MKLTPNQKTAFENIKSAYEGYYNLQPSDYKVALEDSYSNISIKIENPNNSNQYLYSFMGKRGKVSYIGVYADKYEDSQVNSFLNRNIKEDKYERKTRSPTPTYYGIEMYTMDSPRGSSLKSIGIRRNKTTEKFFKKYYPDHSGVSFDYHYIPFADGLLDIFLSDYSTERIYFGYSPSDSIGISNVSTDGGYSHNGYRIPYSEDINIKLTNRQIVAKLFKAWLKHNNLL